MLQQIMLCTSSTKLNCTIINPIKHKCVHTPDKLWNKLRLQQQIDIWDYLNWQQPQENTIIENNTPV